MAFEAAAAGTLGACRSIIAVDMLNACVGIAILSSILTQFL